MTRVGAWLAVALLAQVARAAPLEAVLLPDHPLETAGAGEAPRVEPLRLFLLEGNALVAGVPEVRAQHGAVVGAPAPTPDGGLVVRYRPPRVTGPSADSLRITLGGRTATAPIALLPAGRMRIEVSVTPDPLVLGRGAQAEVKVRAHTAAGEPARAALRLGASVGKVSPLVESAPGEYRATYTPPEEKYPQVAILAVLSLTDGAFAAAPLKLAARVPVSGEGEPGGSMTLSIDGRVFGPQRIGPDGRFTIPVVVPPGGRAVGESVDALGNKRRREIDLALPSFPRLVLAAVPSTLLADGRQRAEVVAFAVDARGNPERGRPPALTSDRGTLSAPVLQPEGSFRWTLTAPFGVGDGRVRLRAGPATATVELRPAPPFEISLEPPEPLPAGSDQPATVVVRVGDESGSPVTGARLQASVVGGRVAAIDELGQGRYALRVVPPRDPGRGAAAVHVELVGLPHGAPRRLSLHPARAPAGQVAAEAWVDDDLGLPVPDAAVVVRGPAGPVEAVTDRFGTARVAFALPAERRFRVTAEARALPGLDASVDWLSLPGKLVAVPSVDGRGAVSAVESAPGALLDADVPLRPAAPVDLELAVERAGATRRVHVRLRDAAGRPLEGPLLYEASAGHVELEQPLHGGEAILRFVPPPHAPPGARWLITVTDARTRVTAFVEVSAK